MGVFLYTCQISVPIFHKYCFICIRILRNRHGIPINHRNNIHIRIKQEISLVQIKMRQNLFWCCRWFFNGPCLHTVRKAGVIWDTCNINRL